MSLALALLVLPATPEDAVGIVERIRATLDHDDAARVVPFYGNTAELDALLRHALKDAPA